MQQFICKSTQAHSRMSFIKQGKLIVDRIIHRVNAVAHFVFFSTPQTVCVCVCVCVCMHLTVCVHVHSVMYKMPFTEARSKHCKQQ